MEFKVGDKIRLLSDDWRDYGFEPGDTVAITEIAAGTLYAGEAQSVGTTSEGLYRETFSCELVPEESDPDPRIKHFEDIEIEASIGLNSFEQSVRHHTNKIADLLIAKNKAYGDAALNPVRIFSKASRIEQLNVRIDDKISRIQRGTDFGDEDTVRDLIGYLVLRLIAEESE